ncbi:helix-turn-helix domain-containing protein [Roseomonas sp. BN140053]|uniref:helix-turn-helix domain-containing protein n=1 Tax=Roseomonas sp. BN140053 TaxID=3391898 RepID=UPI0039EACE9E
MYYTLGEAAKATGISKATISRALKSGKISFVSHENSSYQIDPAELHRVYPAVSRNSSTQPHMERSVTPETVAETGGLQRELDLLREERERERTLLTGQIEDLKRDRDDLRGERDRLLGVIEEQAASVKLLTHEKAVPEPIITPAPPPAAPSPPEPEPQLKGGRLSRAWAVLRGRG